MVLLSTLEHHDVRNLQFLPRCWFSPLKPLFVYQSFRTSPNWSESKLAARPHHLSLELRWQLNVSELLYGIRLAWRMTISRDVNLLEMSEPLNAKSVSGESVWLVQEKPAWDVEQCEVDALLKSPIKATFHSPNLTNPRCHVISCNYMLHCHLQRIRLASANGSELDLGAGLATSGAPKTFQNLNVSSPAADATVQPSGLFQRPINRVNLSVIDQNST